MKSNILPGVALIIAGFIFFVYVNPTLSGPIAETKSAIANDDKALAAAADYENSKNALASARKAIDSSDLTRIVTFLPDSVDNVGLILDINALAARSGVSLSNIDVAKNDNSAAASSGTSGSWLSANPNPVGSVDLSLSVIGTYDAFKSFLVGIEKSARLLDVQSIVVKGSDTGVYNYQMTMRLYWLR